jgi:hypothetical protein
MLTHYFSDPVMLDLIQQTPAAAYLDCLSAELVATGYKRTTIQRYLRAAAHVSYWQHRADDRSPSSVRSASRSSSDIFQAVNAKSSDG